MVIVVVSVTFMTSKCCGDAVEEVIMGDRDWLVDWD